MGLFDDYVDAQQFDSGGGLLGRLLALQQFPGQYQQAASVGQTSDVPQTLSPTSTLSPLLASYGQPHSFGQFSASSLNVRGAAPWPAPGTQDGPTVNFSAGVGSIPPGQAFPQDFMGGGGPPSMGPAASAGTPNTVLAQYFPARPLGFPIPPVFFPGSPENESFVHSTITAGRAFGNAFGNILNSDDGVSRPPPGSRSISKTDWSGDHQEIKKSIGSQPDDDVRISPTGEVWAQKPDGSWENHGPADSFTGSGKPRGRRGKDRDR